MIHYLISSDKLLIDISRLVISNIKEAYFQKMLILVSVMCFVQNKESTFKKSRLLMIYYQKIFIFFYNSLMDIVNSFSECSMSNVEPYSLRIFLRICNPFPE